MRTKKIISMVMLVVLLSLVLTLAGCNIFNNTENTRIVKDIDGLEVTIPTKVTKAVALWAAGNQLMLATGGTDIMYQCYGGFVEHKTGWVDTVWPGLKDKTIFAYDPQTNEAYDPTVEEMVALHPDVIFIDDGDRAKEYRRGGLAVIHCDYSSYENIIKTMEIMGEVFAGEAKVRANNLRKYYNDNINYLREKLSEIDEESKVSIYFLDSQKQTGALRTAGKNTVQEEWATSAGATFPASKLVTGNNKEITAEQLLAMNPDYIFIGGANSSVAYANLMSNKNFASLSAIKNNNVVICPQGTWQWDKPCAECLMQMLFVAKSIYPEKFVELDMVQVLIDFFKINYDCEISREQATLMLQGNAGHEEN